MTSLGSERNERELREAEILGVREYLRKKESLSAQRAALLLSRNVLYNLVLDGPRFARLLWLRFFGAGMVILASNENQIKSKTVKQQRLKKFTSLA